MREKRLEKYLKQAVEYAIVLGAGYVKMHWNSTAGEQVDFIEATKTKIFDGDIEFSNLSPFDVVVDSTKESQDHDWILVRTYKNKYDLAAKYPEHEKKIVGLSTKSDMEAFRFGINTLNNETDDVPVYEFYHKRTDSMPDGRYLLFLDHDIVLHDKPMPYRVLPVFRISPGDILGTPYGYTSLFDILPIQEGINSLYSTILTNQNAFGVQNILVPRGSDINVQNLGGALNAIEYNPAAGKPESLNLTHTPKEIFDFLKMLEGVAETLSGVNSVARGHTEGLGSNPSGTALALIQSMALQFISGLQASYVQLIEDVGTALIKILQDFAETPRMVAIVGRSNRSAMKSFSSKDIASISRVVVDVGNPLSRTTAGRVQMADQLLQYNQIKNPQQYITVINTGRLDVLTEDTQHELLLIKAENEQIVDGDVPVVTLLDEHSTHILEHKSVLADPELRKDPELVSRALTHIQIHIEQLKTGDQQLLVLMGQQPLQPMMQPGAEQGVPAVDPQGNPIPGIIEPPMEGQVGVGPEADTNMISGPGIEQGTRLPSMPTVPAEALANPDLQAQAMGNLQ